MAFSSRLIIDCLEWPLVIKTDRGPGKVALNHREILQIIFLGRMLQFSFSEVEYKKYCLRNDDKITLIIVCITLKSYSTGI